MFSAQYVINPSLKDSEWLLEKALLFDMKNVTSAHLFNEKVLLSLVYVFFNIGEILIRLTERLDDATS